jgi:hypothetical protein
LTESSGYRPFDFIDLTMPQFSYPFVDEVRITSLVNLESEEEIIIKEAKIIAQIINYISNDISHMFDKIVIEDIDLSDALDIEDAGKKADTESVNKIEIGLISSKEFL